MSLLRLSITNTLVAISSFCYSQQIDSIAGTVRDIPGKYYTHVDKKLSSINKRLTKKSVKYLAKFQRHEKRLQEKLGSLNVDATNVFANASEKYNELSGNITSKITKISSERGKYDSYTDTLSTSLSFLKKYTAGANVAKPIASLTKLQSKFQQSEKIKEFVAERKQQIKELLSKYTKVPAGLKKEFTKLNKTAYYYSAQLNEYKEALKDPKKAEQKALRVLNKLPAFQKFMRHNSQLALLFRMPDNNQDGNPIASLAGLQTRASVQALIQQQVSTGGPNARQVIQQNIAQAQSEISKLKDKVNKFGGGSSDIEMPEGFRINPDKTKPFLRRLEFSINIQSQKSTNFFPARSDLGLSVGYRLSPNKIVGVGLAYSVGLGRGWNHIRITQEGFGIRSFADIKILSPPTGGGAGGGLFLSGGYERNYNPAYKRLLQVSPNGGDLEGAAYQNSSLIGLSKKYNIPSAFGKRRKRAGEVRLLYDFLANYHRPVTQPILFRIGYVLK